MSEIKTKLLGPKDVAERFGVPLTWVYAKAEAGKLPHYKMGKYIRFDPQEVEEYLKKQRRGCVNSGHPSPQVSSP
jgi:excisionase family DNA binding protein